MSEPWETSKLFFKPDVPGQRELRNLLRLKYEAGTITMEEASRVMWRWLKRQHGGDIQPEAEGGDA